MTVRAVTFFPSFRLQDPGLCLNPANVPWPCKSSLCQCLSCPCERPHQHPVRSAADWGWSMWRAGGFLGLKQRDAYQTFCESLDLAGRGSVGRKSNPLMRIGINPDKHKLLPSREKGIRSIQLAIRELGELMEGWYHLRISCQFWCY